MLVLMSRFHSQVDKVSPVTDGSPWAENEGHKHRIECKLEGGGDSDTINIYATGFI